VQEYQVSFTKVSLLTGWQLLTVAICGFFISPATRKFGKRPVMMLTSGVGLAGSIWLLYANTYNTVVGARVLQGVAVSFVSTPIPQVFLV
jgi:MFS family permease